MMNLRPYQLECVAKMQWARPLPGNDLVSLPTGSGKSLIISELARRLQEPILILVPSKELLEQDKKKLEHWTAVNVYSAGMNEKTVGNITLATIQSAYKNPELFTQFKVVIVDECDLINPKKLDGMYNTMFKAMGNPKIYGLTATPFRMDSYYKSWGTAFWQKETVHTIKLLTRYKERFWTRMLYVYHTQDLVDQGFLVPLEYQELNYLTQNELSFNRSKSEFDLEDFEKKFNPFLDKTKDLVSFLEGSVLVFCVNITQANTLARLIPNSIAVSSETPAKERERIIEQFRDNKIKVVINVGILLVGFDKPDLQNIVVCRPTRSLRLHMQLLGRGMRPSPGKSLCRIYDLVGNIAVMGRAETMKIMKVEEKWNIVTETKPEGWHYAELYTYKLPLKPTALPSSLEERNTAFE